MAPSSQSFYNPIVKWNICEMTLNFHTVRLLSLFYYSQLPILFESWLSTLTKKKKKKKFKIPTYNKIRCGKLL